MGTTQRARNKKWGRKYREAIWNNWEAISTARHFVRNNRNLTRLAEITVSVSTRSESDIFYIIRSFPKENGNKPKNLPICSLKKNSVILDPCLDMSKRIFQLIEQIDRISLSCINQKFVESTKKCLPMFRQGVQLILSTVSLRRNHDEQILQNRGKLGGTQSRGKERIDLPSWGLWMPQNLAQSSIPVTWNCTSMFTRYSRASARERRR